MHNGSDHAHTHTQTHVKSVDEAAALLHYLLDHNAHHAEELHALSHDLEDYGKTEAAKLLHDCVQDFERANTALAAALEQLKEA